jgi:hypothetical protein
LRPHCRCDRVVHDPIFRGKLYDIVARDNENKTRQGFPKAGPSGRLRDDLEPLRPRRPGPQVTERDVQVLKFIARHGIVTSEQIGRACFPSVWAAYKRLKALDAMALIVREGAWHRAPKVIRVTLAGARIADVGLRPAKLHLAQVPHDVAVVELYLEIESQNPGVELQTERELRAELYRTKEKLRRIPDIVVTIEGRATAVELDMTFKDTRTVESVIAAYERQRQRFADVRWFVDSPKAAQRYSAVVKAKRADDFIEIIVWSA